MKIEFWYIKPDAIDEIIEYIRFYHRNDIEVEKYRKDRNNYIVIKLKRDFIKQSKKDGIDKKELRHHTECYIECVILRFETEKELTYANNVKFSRHMKLKRLLKET